MSNISNTDTHSDLSADALEQIIKVAQKDLIQINNYSAKDALKDAARKALKRATTNRDPLFWPAGMLMLGLSEAALSPSGSASDLISQSISDDIIKCLNSYIEKWIKSGSQVSYVDDSVSGITLIKLYQATGERRYHHAASRIANFLSQAPKTADESIIYNPSKGNDLVYADGAGQSAMFLSKYGTVFHKRNALALAAKQLLNYHANGFDKMSGLPYHAFSLENEKKCGIIGWGRAVGWLMMGYSEILANISNEETHGNGPIGDSILKSTSEKLMAEFYSLVKVTLQYQRPDGGFSWLLPAVEGEPDTSATAMIAYSLSNWLRSGMFRSHAADLAEDAKRALISAKAFLLCHTENGSVNQSLSGCEDIAVHRQQYGHYPWGQGSTLALLSIMQ
ncbi:glycoside hydrolase family 88 protein [Butyrivibrio sp. JL13D10]|uniref:glycoside hydrolase family 88 protein n=1 Tax=Butyrivibrio sp. JL13D10 TaxID=3236815 RepID=UPI0038B565C9